MTHVLKHKNLKCIEWDIQVPTTVSLKVNSETFSYQDRKYKLEFYSGHTHFSDNARLSIGTIFQRHLPKPIPITVSIRVLLNSECLEDHLVKSITNVSEIIWTYPKVLVSCCLTFELLFHEDYSKEDKCIQTSYYMNTDASIGSLPEDFSKLLETELDYDVEVKCSGHSFKTHKLVLCARSEVFKAMLKSDMIEAQTKVVEIQDIDVNCFRDFIKYLYTDVMPVLTFDKAKVFYEAGDKYAIRSLMLRCADYLQDNLSPENAFECYALADAHSDQNLKDKVISYVLDKKFYLQENHWLPFCENFPNAALEVY